MNKNQLRPLLALCLVAAASAPGAVLYVDLNSATPTPPYTSSATAATNIQDAVDAAAAGDRILVTNGVYPTGGRLLSNLDGTTNRVAVDKPVTVQSVNGPQFTFIEGFQVPGTTLGPAAIRCVYVEEGASLTGFTLTNGAADNLGGGVLGSTPSGGVLSNCVLIGNVSYYGGGAAGCTLNGCVLIGNKASSVDGEGGGAFSSVLNNCTLRGNSAAYGGGASTAQANNCLFTGNSASGGGGGFVCSLNNCTITGNSADYGGGTVDGGLTNCIVYFNTAAIQGANFFSNNSLSMGSCCTTPMPATGVGNITNTPMFVDTNNWVNLRLESGSPCIDAGDNAGITSSVDLDGKERLVGSRVDVGAYEWVSVPTHYVSQTSPNPTSPFLSWSTAATNIQDAVDQSDQGDRVLVTNGIYQTGGRWTGMSNRVAVTRAMRVESVNGPSATAIVGFQVPGATNGDGAIRCAYLAYGASLSGFTLTNGGTRFIGNDPAGEGGGVFCETTIEVVSNCLLIGNSAAYRGGGSFNGTLRNCTLKGNSVLGGDGGGAFSGRLINCVLTLNQAEGGGGAAGDTAHPCTLYSCKLAGNSAAFGGGAEGYFDFAACNLNNCTVTDNRAIEGGGVYSCTAYDSIVYYNTASDMGDNYDHDGLSRLSSSCTTPLPSYYGNFDDFTNAPTFVDYPGGDLRLQTNSPCINAGVDYLLLPVFKTDLDGNPRKAGARVDLGAYEFQGAGLNEFTGWLWKYGLRTDGSADYLDSDGDSANNWQEWVAGTIPTNASSALRLYAPAPSVSGVTVSWQSVSNRTYSLERGNSLASGALFSVVASNIPGQDGTTSLMDTNAFGPGPFFYRVGVSSP